LTESRGGVDRSRRTWEDTAATDSSARPPFSLRSENNTVRAEPSIPGLGESTDPEALGALLATYFERMKALAERHGGTVEKFIGNAVMPV
jgi:hypothetical protein